MTEARNRSLWRLARPLAAVGALLMASGVTGCADDEAADETTTAGAGGTTSAGGSSGIAGKGGGGAAGSSGTGGTAGTGGKAGTGGGGAGGSTGGSGGKAGTGGSTGGSGGKAGTGGSTGGSGGTTGGSGGTTGGSGGTTGGSGGSTAGSGGSTGGSGGSTGGSGGSGGSAALCGPDTGTGMVNTPTKVADGGATFVSPFDATPSPDGCMVYFTAIDPATGLGGVFMVDKTDGTGTVKRIDTGDMLIAPSGIAVSSDGATLYVADPGAAKDYASGSIANDDGAVYTLSSGGGTPTAALSGFSPRTISVVSENNVDVVYFGGQDPATGTAGIFSLSGSSATPVVTGGLTDAGGIAGDGSGTLYAVSTTGANGWATLYQITGGTATALAGPLKVGFPAGVALSTDKSAVVVSALDPATYTDAIAMVTVADKKVTYQAPIKDTLVEAAGLHRAQSAELYAFVDGLGTSGAGAVYVVVQK